MTHPPECAECGGEMVDNSDILCAACSAAYGDAPTPVGDTP